ncbi:MAG: transposase [Chloroflexota bacterium]|nr:transposase [Chloroflexota bacterium]
MNAFDLLLDQWTRQVKEIFPKMHVYQQEALAMGVLGVMLSGNAVMRRVAEEVWERGSSETKLVSHERRLQRFVANERIEVAAWWKTFLEQVLPCWQGKPVTLVLDLTPYTQEATIVYLGLLVHSRVLPLAWRVMPQQESWDQGQWEILEDLFDEVASALSASACTLLADRGLTGLPLIRLCQHRNWHYVLRIKQQEWLRRKYRHFYQDWQPASLCAKKEGEQWCGQILLWQEHQYETWLSACWEPGYEEPWLVISDQRASPRRVKEYAKRMKVEATFQDHKSRGCFIECSRFTNRDHLHRWLLVVYLATWWIAHLGRSCLHHGHRQEVDRTDRRDKGLLRIGRLWLKAILKKATRDLRSSTPHRVPAQVANCFPFSHRRKRLWFSIDLQ